jgi:hypothetical protein
MEESYQNERMKNNNDEIYLNDVVMEKEFEIQPSLQTEERNKWNLKNLASSKKKMET